MTGGARRNFWLRMTDSIGVTEPGKQPERGSPKFLTLQVVVWLASSGVWVYFIFRTLGDLEQQILYGGLAFLSFALATVNIVLLRQATKGPGKPTR
ncbi:hypothetical protein [Pseudarthrobacter oxydans]|uniref:hypothetical protein n=1 Tax=Pseudarthrobacter oxydans TaxID=1671 RepID=UPI003821E872